MTRAPHCLAKQGQVGEAQELFHRVLLRLAGTSGPPLLHPAYMQPWVEYYRDTPAGSHLTDHTTSLLLAAAARPSPLQRLPRPDPGDAEAARVPKPLSPPFGAPAPAAATAKPLYVAPGRRCRTAGETYAEGAQEGCRELPFPDMATALAIAGKGYTIVLLPGVYDPFTVLHPTSHITIQGEGPVTILATADEETMLFVADAAHLTLRNLRFCAYGRRGCVAVEAVNCPNLSLTDCHFYNTATDLDCPTAAVQQGNRTSRCGDRLARLALYEAPYNLHWIGWLLAAGWAALCTALVLCLTDGAWHTRTELTDWIFAFLLSLGYSALAFQPLKVLLMWAYWSTLPGYPY